MARAKRYELDDSVLGDTKVKATGQAVLIINSLMNRHPQTAQEIADDIKAKLTTRQDPLRVVAFYLSTWKKTGMIVVSEDETPVATKPIGEDPVASEDVGEGVTGRDHEREVAELEEQPERRNGYDFVNTPLSEAVAEVLSSVLADPATPKIIAEELQVLGRTVTAEQVGGTTRKLAAKGRLVKVGDGRYAVATKEYAASDA